MGTVTGEMVREIVRAHGGRRLLARPGGRRGGHLRARVPLSPRNGGPPSSACGCAPRRGSRTSPLRLPGARQTAELIGTREVRITDAEGRIGAQRIDPRSLIPRARRQFRWDDLDFIYFAGYATWNYLATPFLFLRDGFVFRLLDPVPGEPRDHPAARDLSRRHPGAQPRAGLPLRRRAPAAAHRLHRGGRRRLGARRALLRGVPHLRRPPGPDPAARPAAPFGDARCRGRRSSRSTCTTCAG